MKLFSAFIRSDLHDAWQNDATAAHDGSDLMNALQSFNSGEYVVDPHGGYIAAVVAGDVDPLSVQANDSGSFWDYVL